MKKISIIILLFLILIFLILIVNNSESYSDIYISDKDISGDIDIVNNILKNRIEENNNKITQYTSTIGSNYINKNPYNTPKYIGSILPSFKQGIMRLYNLLLFYIN